MARPTNKAQIEKVLNKIKEMGYKIKQTEFGDSYFIFNRGKDSICHFRIKGLKGWLFAYWLGNYSDNQNDKDIHGCFFAQFEKDIDKFKPSRSFYKSHLLDSDFTAPNGMYEVRDILDTIRKYPYVAHVYSSSYCEPPYTSPFKARLICLKWWFEGAKEYLHVHRIRRKLFRRLRVYRFFGIVKDYIITEGEPDSGWKTSPRYTIYVFSPSKYADKVDDKLEKIRKLEGISSNDFGYHIETVDATKENLLWLSKNINNKFGLKKISKHHYYTVGRLLYKDDYSDEKGD